MKVLYINTVFEKGSTGRIVKDLGTMVEKNGGEYRAIYGRGYSEDYHAVKLTSKIDVFLHALFSRITDRAGFYSKKSTQHIVEYIRNYNPDIIHLHNLHGYYINLGILFEYLKNEYKGKVIWTLHDCWAFTGHCVHYSWVKCDKWKTQCFNCPEKKRYPRSMFMDNSYKNFLEKKKLLENLSDFMIVTPSVWLANQVRESFFKKCEIRTINNGIDLDVFKMKERKVEKYFKGKKVLLSVMDGFDERKGCYDLIKLSKILPLEYQIVVVGISKKDLKKFPKEIEVIEKTESKEKLVEIYNKAEYFLNLTYEDTFPTVNIEALACGVPVITYDSGGSKESLSIESGIIIEKGNLKDIKETILKKFFDSNNCRKQAEKFNKINRYQEYMALYEEEE